jgi:hypothetical protein
MSAVKLETVFGCLVEVSFHVVRGGLIRWESRWFGGDRITGGFVRAQSVDAPRAMWEALEMTRVILVKRGFLA